MLKIWSLLSFVCEYCHTAEKAEVVNKIAFPTRLAKFVLDNLWFDCVLRKLITYPKDAHFTKLAILYFYGSVSEV